ncbi:MAG: hypothetical protein IKD37_08120 [Clostridia bacterium]|nr:hypothetical protein [Clostridia bacterium]
MARKHTKMKILAEEVFRRKEAGETNRQIAESYGLTKNSQKCVSSSKFRAAAITHGEKNSSAKIVIGKQRTRSVRSGTI